MKRRSSVIGKRGAGKHQVEPNRESRPAGQIKPVISKSKHGKMIRIDEFHDNDGDIGPDFATARRLFRGCLLFGGIMAIVCLLLFCSAVKAHGQTEFISPFHVVITAPQPGSKSITDIYHVPTHVVITETTVSIGVDSEGGSRFNYPIQGVEHETGKNRYIIPDGIIIHAVNKEGETVTWINSKFQWRLYSFLPQFIEIEN